MSLGCLLGKRVANGSLRVNRIYCEGNVPTCYSISYFSLLYLIIATTAVCPGCCCVSCALGFASFGLIPPIGGAFIQEAIDVAVIINALRASR